MELKKGELKLLPGTEIDPDSFDSKVFTLILRDGTDTHLVMESQVILALDSSLLCFGRCDESEIFTFYLVHFVCMDSTLATPK